MSQSKDLSNLFKVIALVLVLMFSSFGLTITKASEGDSVSKNPCVSDFEKYEKVESEIIKSENNNIVYEIKELEKAAEELGIPLKDEDGEGTLVGLAYSYLPQEKENPIISPAALFIKLTGTGEGCDQTIIRSSYYAGPAKARMEISEKVSASYNASVDIDAKIVSITTGCKSNTYNP